MLVFSPHPDDETIALGGLLFRLAHARVPVRVVFLTSGDGYLEAAQARFRDEHPNPVDYLALGRLREDEARAAAARLGLGPEALRFLGFPDEGLADLWGPYWARRYTSPRTGASRPPYPDSVAPGADFQGTRLVSLLERQLTEFGPTVVVMPHPSDTHLDHAHTSYFVTEALHSLQEHAALSRDVLVLAYLVHHPSWPSRVSASRDVLRPLVLPDTRWDGTELSATERAAKRAALEEYRSQLAVMQGFLHSFLGRNELLARVDSHVLDRIAAVH